MNIIKFRIDGRAQPQGRPRTTTVNGKVRMYDPPKSRNYKQAVGLVGRSYMARNRLKPITGPVKVTLDFYFKPPKSYSEKRLQDIWNGAIKHTKTFDVDNLAKAVTDGLNKIAYVDDAQIVELVARKHYGESDYTDVAIEIIEEDES